MSMSAEAGDDLCWCGVEPVHRVVIESRRRLPARREDAPTATVGGIGRQTFLLIRPAQHQGAN
jgi:hypothetical protein